MKNNTTNIDQSTFNFIYDTLDRKKSLSSRLIQMQVNNGVSDNKAAIDAESVIRNVYQDNSSEKENISNKSQKAIRDFLYKSEKMTGKDHIRLLQQCEFGLRLYHDYYLIDRQFEKDDINVGEWFWYEYGGKGYDDEDSVNDMRENIFEMLCDYPVPDVTVKLNIDRLSKSKDMLATSIAIGKESLCLRSFAALSCYQRLGDEERMDTCVFAGKLDPGTKAASDAISTGYITRKISKKALGITTKAVGAAGLAIGLLRPVLTKAIPGSSYKKLSSKSFALLAVSVLLNITHADEVLSRMLGKAAANIRYPRQLKKLSAKACEEHDFIRILQFFSSPNG